MITMDVFIAAHIRIRSRELALTLSCSISDKNTTREGAPPVHVCLQEKAAQCPAERAISARKSLCRPQVKKLPCLHKTEAPELPRNV